MKRSYSAVLLVCLSACLICFGLVRLFPAPDLSKTYRIGTDRVYPYHDVDASGAPRGFVAEVLSEAARRNGVKLEWRPTTKTLLGALNDGDVDLWPLVSTDLKQSHPALHTTAPWLNNDYAFVAINPLFRNPANFSTIQTVAGRRSSGIEKLAREHFRQGRFAAHTDRRAAIEAVCRGDADGAIVELRVAHYFLAAPPPACAGKVPCFIGLTFRREQMVTAARPEAAAIADLLRAEIGRMAKDGALDRILLPWAYYQTEEIRAIFTLDESERRHRWAIAAATVLLLLAAGLLWQQRALYLVRMRQDSAQKESLAKTQVLRWVSHELRTPLNGILATSSVLLRNPDATREDSAELLHTIHSSANVLTRLVDDLLDAAHLLGPAPGPVYLRPVIADLPKLLAETAAEFGARVASQDALIFITDIAQDLPRYVTIDEVRIRQVLNNLLANALAHTSKGYIRLHVECGGLSRLRVEVSDSGSGIAAADRDLLFEAFHRAAESRKSHRGLGLGLAISREIVHGLGGHIGFDRERAHGSLFWFEIDLQPAEAPPVAPPEPATNQLRVLVVDDDPVSRRILSRLMNTLHCDVATAEDGLQAVSLAREGRFDLILMDCQMPNMDGFEATRRIRRHSQQAIYIAGCTANCFDADVRCCIEAGMDEVIGKPVDYSKLRALTESLRAARA